MRRWRSLTVSIADWSPLVVPLMLKICGTLAPSDMQPPLGAINRTQLLLRLSPP